MSGLERKKEKDAKEILDYIEKNTNKNGIISMFLKGPPMEDGFMWCSNEGGQGFHWTDEEAKGLRAIEAIVLQKGWDLSGYGFMMRYIQSQIPLKPPSSPKLERPLACACLCGKGGCRGCVIGENVWRRIQSENKWKKKFNSQIM